MQLNRFKGYDYYFSYSAQLIREQLSDTQKQKIRLLCPEIQSIPNGVYEVFCEEIHYEYLGYLIAVTFKVGNYEEQRCVLLPGRSKEHIQLYENLKGSERYSLELVRISEE